MSLDKPNKDGYYTGGVAFNGENPEDEARRKHARKRPNFSGYVKYLIDMDRYGMIGGKPAAAPAGLDQDQEEESMDLDPDLMRNIT